MDFEVKSRKADIPFGMLFVGFSTVTDGLRAELDQTVVELPMCPIKPWQSEWYLAGTGAVDSLWVGCITQTEGGEPQLVETARAKAGAAQRPPELLAVGRELALARGGDCDENDSVLQQLALRGWSDWGLAVDSSAYKADGVQLRDVDVKAQAFGEPSQLLCDVLGGARLGGVDDQGAAGGGRGHGRR